MSSRAGVSALAALLVLAALTSLTMRPPAAAAQPVTPEEPQTAPPVRLVLSTLGVDALVASLDLAADGTMPAPTRADLVAWYRFSALAGGDGNVVLAGHRDWQGRRGVFVALGQLGVGDELWLQDALGTWHRYTVVWLASYADDAAPIAALVGPTERPSLTLITCAGAFDRTHGRYLERQVVRAERLDADPAATADP